MKIANLLLLKAHFVFHLHNHVAATFVPSTGVEGFIAP